MSSVRHAIYWVPEGDLADWGARWLGWDPRAGRERPHPDPALGALTEEPRRYGLHATLKAPFRLTEGHAEADLEQAIAALAARLAPAQAPGLVLARIGRFLALVPEGDTGPIDALAAACVTGLDAFRAALTDADLARRRAAGLDPQEESHLLRWGYPHVLDRFRFHVTLTGPLDEAQEEAARALLDRHPPPLPRPFRLAALGHVVQGPDGRFRLRHRYALSG
ncbi:DUF1045 domain-containing protein [Rubellimicrobium roseum]|uniref:DUF1045 domain-containing protein n=1 Tax=Rubellimicrobium roseum TaxID=687525 RepID=A0A5C4N9Q4_9RHOB|nr:DUF1045 domain-containing protein [Rubellimicrobium roseum]TNC71333.1 DUF1045 domain-containing protein [Rubellimicrobium roseum]